MCTTPKIYLKASFEHHKLDPPPPRKEACWLTHHALIWSWTCWRQFQEDFPLDSSVRQSATIIIISKRSSFKKCFSYSGSYSETQFYWTITVPLMTMTISCISLRPPWLNTGLFHKKHFLCLFCSLDKTMFTQTKTTDNIIELNKI